MRRVDWLLAAASQHDAWLYQLLLIHSLSSWWWTVIIIIGSTVLGGPWPSWGVLPIRLCQGPLSSSCWPLMFACLGQHHPPDDEQQACSKHVEACYWNKLIENGASCWFMLYGNTYLLMINWFCGMRRLFCALSMSRIYFVLKCKTKTNLNSEPDWKIIPWRPKCRWKYNIFCSLKTQVTVMKVGTVLFSSTFWYV
jgi:hypothetical protein